ncbi:MAG: hypothetical protein ABIK45_10230 [Pseudomonadota bacterium]
MTQEKTPEPEMQQPEKPRVLFERAGTDQILKDFLVKLDRPANDPTVTTAKKYINDVVSAMISNPSGWDENCQVNIKWIGDQFIETLKSGNWQEKRIFDNILTICFRFLTEYNTVGNAYSDLHNRYSSFVNSVIDTIDSSAAHDIQFAERYMPTAILKEMINSTNFLTISKLHEVRAKTEKQITELEEKLHTRRSKWDDELQGRQIKAERLRTYPQINRLFLENLACSLHEE